MGIYIEGLGISGYKSFGKNEQRIGPLSKVNIFAGQNNSGKSNILSYLMSHYGTILNSIRTPNARYKFDGLDIPMKNWDRITRVEIGITHNGEYYNNFLGKESLKSGNLFKSLDTVLKSNVLSNGTNVAWLRFEAPPDQGFSFSQETINQIATSNLISHDQWQRLWMVITSRGSGGSLKEHWIPQTLTKIVELIKLPAFSIIPSVRRYSAETTDKTDDYSGLGIIDKLAKLQNPSYREQTLKNRFQKINNFVRLVTGNSTATLEIPHARDTILVHMDEKTLPITSLGTGIHEVIILASAATTLNEQVVCIEEPEIHMHPELQKKFIEYLEKETTNQYFITTHSASILDRPSTSIFHVSNVDGISTVTPVSSPVQRFSVCMDLGYRASDLVQSNCIIWVEGPSDRIYLKWWINSLDPTLVEGLHYSLMFYGGRLLSHLTANDPEIDEFISLRRLNRHISIVIDSDRKSKKDDINETKKRVRDEFEAGSGTAWVTAGREIENYIDRNVLETAAKKVHPSIDSMKKYSNEFSDPLKTSSKFEIDKVKLAHEIIHAPVDFDVLDLREKTEALVDFIRVSNRLDKLFESNIDKSKTESAS